MWPLSGACFVSPLCSGNHCSEEGGRRVSWALCRGCALLACVHRLGVQPPIAPFMCVE